MDRVGDRMTSFSQARDSPQVKPRGTPLVKQACIHLRGSVVTVSILNYCVPHRTHTFYGFGGLVICNDCSDTWKQELIRALSDRVCVCVCVRVCACLCRVCVCTHSLL